MKKGGDGRTRTGVVLVVVGVVGVVVGQVGVVVGVGVG